MTDASKRMNTQHFGSNESSGQPHLNQSTNPDLNPGLLLVEATNFQGIRCTGTGGGMHSQSARALVTKYIDLERVSSFTQLCCN